MSSSSPRWVMRPMSTAPTCKVWPIWRGSSSLPLNLNTVLRARTLRFGSCESVLIRLSVRPSLRYSLPESAVALTKGSTAMDVIFSEADLERSQKKLAAAAMTRIAATNESAKILRERAGEGAAVIDEALADEVELASAAALDERPESRSRFRRARSERRSAALW